MSMNKALSNKLAACFNYNARQLMPNAFLQLFHQKVSEEAQEVVFTTLPSKVSLKTRSPYFLTLLTLYSAAVGAMFLLC
jgi:hypothetical protein